MSLPESYTDLSGKQAPSAVTEKLAPFPSDPAVARLRAALDGILIIAGEQSGQQRRIGQVYIFRGRLQQPAETAYATLAERLKALGYTPMLRREHDEAVVIAVRGQIVARGPRTRWWLHLGLLLLTILTTTVMGAALTGMPTGAIVRAAREGNTRLLWPALRDGLPFSLTLLTILGVHEMGHYVAARLHGVRVTLPFFIPLPLTNSLGTMGAVIFIKSPLLNRRALFDVGIAGPLAGLAAALPLYVIGLSRPQAVGLPINWIQLGIVRVANPPLLDWLARHLADVTNPDRVVLYGHPMALAAWFGVLLTALNLLPLGQFDGGHVAYALLGRRAWSLAGVTFLILLVLGVGGMWTAWLVWAIMGFLMGLRHPPPYDDLSPLGWRRAVIGGLTALLFILIITPMPFYNPY